MRAYQLPKGGSGIDALVKVERPNPKPAYRQVLVKVAACSLNFRDLGIVRGTSNRARVAPVGNGTEIQNYWEGNPASLQKRQTEHPAFAGGR